MFLVDSSFQKQGRIPDAYIVIDKASHVRIKALLVYASSQPVAAVSHTSSWLHRLLPASWTAMLYIGILIAIVLAQPESQLMLRHLWKQAARQGRYLARHFA